MRRQIILILLSVLIVAMGLYANPFTLKVTGLPFTVNLVNARTGIIQPVPGIMLPAGLQAGDAIDLPALDTAARTAISLSAKASSLPRAHTYVFMIQRTGGTDVPVTVTTVELDKIRSVKWTQQLLSYQSLLLVLIALIVLWRGRDRAAMGVFLWTAGNLVGGMMNTTDPFAVMDIGYGAQDRVALIRLLVAWTLLLLARTGFYITIESSVRAGLRARALLAWRGLFLLSLVGTAVVALGGPVVYIATGFAELLRGTYGLLVTASYFPSVLLLIAGYRTAATAVRPRLRWMLWGSLLWTVGVLLTNEPQWGVVVTLLLGLGVFTSLGIIAIIYAVLRHRLVDVAVVIDHTLVYGATTMLVIGVIAVVNSLALHAAVGAGASLVLQIIVPLALGIVLGQVRRYMDIVVERVFFRRRYLAARRLKGFVERCGHILGIDSLLNDTIMEIGRYSRSPGLALYEPVGNRYVCAASGGSVQFPKQLPLDDPAMVEARAGHEAVDTPDLDSAIGRDACIFPISVIGVLQGVLVCANRPGEHYAADEKKLIGQSAHDVGAAWRILQARDNREYVRAMARGELTLAKAKSRARSLETAWNVC
ncbi:MAG: hypothetical protein KGL13_08450 [Gammaproteobacteria bacterium]|nr:hypothetical protein [Gammaproteobacteria bacterium]